MAVLMAWSEGVLDELAELLLLVAQAAEELVVHRVAAPAPASASASAASAAAGAQAGETRGGAAGQGCGGVHSEWRARERLRRLGRRVGRCGGRVGRSARERLRRGCSGRRIRRPPRERP
jgi:hypothetical protein